MTRYRAVFFDAGETLVYPHPSFPELFTRALQAEGLQVDPAVVRGRLSVISERFVQAAAAGELWSTSPERSRAFWDSVYAAFLQEVGLPFGDGLAERLYRTFTDLSNYRLFDDVPSVLHRLVEAGLVLGVVSNFEEWLERLLEVLGVAQYFEVRVISGVEGMEKPDARIFRLALERAGVDEASSVYVGDSPFFDVDAAAAVGMTAVLIDRGGRHPTYEGIRIVSLEELPGLVGVER